MGIFDSLMQGFQPQDTGLSADMRKLIGQRSMGDMGAALLAASAPTTDPRSGSLAYILSQGLQGMNQGRANAMNEIVGTMQLKEALKKKKAQEDFQKNNPGLADLMNAGLSADKAYDIQRGQQESQNYGSLSSLVGAARATPEAVASPESGPYVMSEMGRFASEAGKPGQDLMSKYLMEKPPTIDNIIELTLKAQAGDPTAQAALDDIKKQEVAKAAAGASRVTQNMGGKLETKEHEAKGTYNVNDLYKPVSEQANVARKLNSQLDVMEKVDFNSGWGAETASKAANALAALGVKDASKYATDAQTFNAAAKEIVLQKQLAQKGPQTESDAKRLESTGAQLGNTPDANKFIMAVAKAQNNRTIAFQQFLDNWWNKNQTYEGAEAAWYDGEGGKSIFEDPALKKFERRKGSGAASAPAGPVRRYNPVTGRFE